MDASLQAAQQLPHRADHIFGVHHAGAGDGSRDPRRYAEPTIKATKDTWNNLKGTGKKILKQSPFDTGIDTGLNLVAWPIKAITNTTTLAVKDLLGTAMNTAWGLTKTGLKAAASVPFIALPSEGKRAA